VAARRGGSEAERKACGAKEAEMPEMSFLLPLEFCLMACFEQVE
jgi:hypothetical protein